MKWPAPTGRRAVLLALVASVLLAGLIAASGTLAPAQTAWHDLQARVLAARDGAPGVLVVDIDEASVAALRPQFGGWPPDRALLALVTEYLLDIGARSVAIDLVLADPRDGDAALAATLARHPGRIVLAVSVAPSPPGDGEWLPPQPGPGGCGAQAWPGLLMPSAALMAASPVLGMVSTPTDDDGQLRALSLWHASTVQGVPALALASLLAADGVAPGGLACAAGQARAGDRRWPVDAASRVRPRWPARGDAVALRPYLSVVQAARGVLRDDDLRVQVQGRSIVIGASAVLNDRVQTPLGPRWAPAALAQMQSALATGALFAPPRLALDALWWLLALLPGAIALRRGRLRSHADLAWCAATLLALLLLDAAGVLWRAQLSNVLQVLVVPASLAALSQWNGRRVLRAERLQLERERAGAEAASRMKSEFLAHMSHEIRTPMNALLGSAELLAQTRLDERQGRHVALFQSAGASLMEILNDLLDLSKIEAGLLELHRQPFSLVELVASQTVLFEARASQKGLRLLTQFDPELPAVVDGDAPRLAQVLRNLLGNAVKFTQRGSVTLAVHRLPDTPGHLRFEVRDTGIGIPADRQRTIFEAFAQADSGVARAYGGTGLGLTISSRLVALMGGRIGVESREGEGSCFFVEVALPASIEAPVAVWAVSTPGPDGAMLSSLRILLADDNPQNVLLVQAYLEGEGHRLDVVHDGAAAVERFAAQAYDLVLMDVQMPGMDGYQATAALRALERRRGSAPVPVVALTANALPDDERRSLQAGCQAHLTKPFSRAQLRRVIARLTGATEQPAASHRPEIAAFADAPPPLPALAALPGFDLATALARMEGQVALYLRVLQAARDALAAWNGRFAAAQAAGDGAQALRLAHDLKSTAATLGAVPLASAAAQVEALLRQNAAVPPELIRELEAQIQLLLGALTEL
ncbi:ATP-binding protein [Rhizobacter sp. OV335]|uniref:ATP-binding protein n=1 Tax=Rhizobacter sp. OV335 TaxID=1500264 RepID=UPI00091A74CE|nr:ATP-binding protein [Rhizobacter sp. OV335]SHN28041.1 Signal transduction histidine kinase [Rhizobacter sp. OV335]